MKLEVRLFAGLSCRNESLPCSGRQEFMLDAPDGITVGALQDLLGIGAATIVTVVNGVIEKKDLVLRNNDRVGMFPPIAGGCKRNKVL
jgi:molybdopterin converting factor small subunit